MPAISAKAIRGVSRGRRAGSANARRRVARNSASETRWGRNDRDRFVCCIFMMSSNVRRLDGGVTIPHSISRASKPTSH